MKSNITNRSHNILQESFIDHVASGKCAKIAVDIGISSLQASWPGCDVRTLASGSPKIDSWWWQRNCVFVASLVPADALAVPVNLRVSSFLWFSSLFHFIYSRFLRFRLFSSFSCSSVYLYRDCYSSRGFPLLLFSHFSFVFFIQQTKRERLVCWRVWWQGFSCGRYIRLISGAKSHKMTCCYRKQHLCKI